jgi:hypothetical protein
LAPVHTFVAEADAVSDVGAVFIDAIVAVTDVTVAHVGVVAVRV